MEKLEEYRWPLLKGLTISLFFLYFFIKGKLLGESDFYNTLDLTFGVYYYLFIFYPLLQVSLMQKGNRRRESALRIRLFSAVLFFFFCTFIVLMKEVEASGLAGSFLEEEFVRTAWEEMSLGGAATSLMHLLYFNLDRNLLMKGIIAGAVFTGFLSFAKVFTDSVRSVAGSIKRKRERRELLKKDRELFEKISIKEEIEKQMSLKKQKSLKSQEEKIQQEVDKFIEEKKNNVLVEPAPENKRVEIDQLVTLAMEQKREAAEEENNKVKDDTQEVRKEDDTSI